MQPAQALHDGAFFVVELGRGLFGERLEVLGVGQAFAFAGLLGEFARLQRGLVEFLALEADQGQFALPLLPCGRQRGEAATEFAHFLGLLQVGLSRRFDAAERIQQL